MPPRNRPRACPAPQRAACGITPEWPTQVARGVVQDPLDGSDPAPVTCNRPRSQGSCGGVEVVEVNESGVGLALTGRCCSPGCVPPAIRLAASVTWKSASYGQRGASSMAGVPVPTGACGQRGTAGGTAAGRWWGGGNSVGRSKCPLCGHGQCTLTHLAQTCSAIEPHRQRVWRRVRSGLLDPGVRGTLMEEGSTLHQRQLYSSI